jgi:ElaB/YqjD/DUF883 family membrane-anchored ribosome-binding protein
MVIMSHHSDLNTYAHAGERVLNAVKRNPEGLLLLAAGCALLLRSRSSAQTNSGQGYVSKDDWRRTYDAGPATRNGASGANGEGVQKGVLQVAEQAKEYASDTAERVNQSVRSYASAALESAQEVQQRATASVHDVQRQTSEYAQKFSNEAQTTFRNTVDYVLREQPLAVVLAGVAAGAAVAAAFPPTDFERGTIGGVGSRVVGAAQDAGGEIKDTAARAGERLKEAVKDPSKLKETVSGIVDDVSRSLGQETDGEPDRGTTGNAARHQETDRPGGGHGASGSSAPGNAYGAAARGGSNPGASGTNPSDRR